MPHALRRLSPGTSTAEPEHPREACFPRGAVAPIVAIRETEEDLSQQQRSIAAKRIKKAEGDAFAWLPRKYIYKYSMFEKAIP